MKFGQIIEYNIRSIFLEKPYPNYGGETTRPVSKKSKLGVSLDLQRFIRFDFTVCQIDDYRNILKLNSRPHTFTSKAF